MRTIFNHYTSQGNSVAIGATPVYVDTFFTGPVGIGDQVYLEYLISNSATTSSANLSISSPTSISLPLIVGENLVRSRVVYISTSDSTYWVEVSNASGSYITNGSTTFGGGLRMGVATTQLILEDTSASPADGTLVAQMGLGFYIQDV